MLESISWGGANVITISWIRSGNARVEKHVSFSMLPPPPRRGLLNNMSRELYIFAVLHSATVARWAGQEGE
jgi:hypothetical protein